MIDDAASADADEEEEDNMQKLDRFHPEVRASLVPFI